MDKWLHRIWYEGGSLYWLLLPLSGLYWLLISARRALYRLGVFRRHRADVPVIVVGNITAGGTGKTPVTIWLARLHSGCRQPRVWRLEVGHVDACGRGKRPRGGRG